MVSVLVVYHSLEELHRALRERAEAINISRLQIDRHAGLPDGYAGKILAPKPSKRLSVDGLFKLAPALGLDLALVENPAYLARILARSPLREAGHANHAGTVTIVFSKRYMRKNAKKGGQNSRKYMSRRQARVLAKKAINTYWARIRNERAERSGS